MNAVEADVETSAPRAARAPGAAAGAQRRRLSHDRWHFHHGPIDCLIDAQGEATAIDQAIDRAWTRFARVLTELVAELPSLRTDLSSPAGARIAAHGVVAARMVRACRPHADAGLFVTAMAAVAGSVAEELIGCFDDAKIARASVNNGGDIALRLMPGAAYELGIVVDPARARAHHEAPPVRITLDASSPVRGVATSGWRGRSFSFGIADSVTVLAPTASVADALATVIANAVDVDDPRIVRVPADRLRDDTDLGERLVTCAVPMLSPAAIDEALAAGAAQAERQIAAGRACAVVLCLQGRVRTCVPPGGFATLTDSFAQAARTADARPVRCTAPQGALPVRSRACDAGTPGANTLRPRV